MIRVGFVTSPLTSGHAVRGVGMYVKHLLPQLKKQAYNRGIEIIEINNPQDVTNLRLDMIHYPFFDLFWHSLPIVKPVKTIVTIHDVIPLEFPEHYPPGLRGSFNLQLQRLALAGVDQVIVDSYASLKAVHNCLQVPHQKLKLVYLAAGEKFRQIKDQKLLAKVKQKYSFPEKFVLYVGDVNWNKNIPGLIKACAEIKYSLVIVGKQAKELNDLDLTHPELQHLQGVDWQGVIRLGFVPEEDLVVIYNLAKVYCQPSFAEGFGIPVLEALACRTPVACSRTHSLPEIAGSAVTYFDPHDIKGMAKAILSAKYISGINQVAKFSWERTADETLAVYSS